MKEEKIQIIIALFILHINHFVEVVFPDQIHLSLGDCPGQMVVTWITFKGTSCSTVIYGTVYEGLRHKADGSCKMFTDGGQYKTVRYIHKVVLNRLQPDAFYVYRCGSTEGLSNINAFKTCPEGTNWSPRLIVFGDMGWLNAVSLPYIVNEVKTNSVDAILHVGDIAYNLESCNGAVGDQFLRMIQSVATAVPYMTAPGNHESAYNFSNYKNRFSMPGNSQGLFYSFNLGPAHFIVISTEVYYFAEYGYDTLVNQYYWLRNDLKEASKAKNRVTRPWIIVFGHRPMYCGSDTGEDCAYPSNVLKCCIFGSYNFGLEDLFIQYRVDLFISGHMHYYLRSWPIYKNNVYNGSCQDPYRNPQAPIHIITGAAGMSAGTEQASNIPPSFFPFFSRDYSYTKLIIYNTTHLLLKQISINQCGRDIDCVWIVKDYVYAYN